MIRVYLDNVLVDNPINWDELQSTLRRDDDFNSIFLTQESALTFVGMDMSTYILN